VRRLGPGIRNLYSAGGLPAAGYEPRSFRNVQFFASSSIAAPTSGSEEWPSMSTKKWYSHGFLRDGLDSILVRFMLRYANGLSIL